VAPAKPSSPQNRIAFSDLASHFLWFSSIAAAKSAAITQIIPNIEPFLLHAARNAPMEPELSVSRSLVCI
jgi:hypothetical protein